MLHPGATVDEQEIAGATHEEPVPDPAWDDRCLTRPKLDTAFAGLLLKDQTDGPRNEKEEFVCGRVHLPHRGMEVSRFLEVKHADQPVVSARARSGFTPERRRAFDGECRAPVLEMHEGRVGLKRGVLMTR